MVESGCAETPLKRAGPRIRLPVEDPDEDDDSGPEYIFLNEYNPEAEKFHVKFMRSVEKDNRDPDMLAIWKPDLAPPPFHSTPKLGDVGFMKFGQFCPVFNILSEHANDNYSGLPKNIELIPLEPTDIVREPAYYPAGTILCTRGVSYEDITPKGSSIKHYKFSVRRGIWGWEPRGVAFFFLADTARESISKDRLNEWRVLFKRRYEYWSKFLYDVDLTPEPRGDTILIYGIIRAVRWIRVAFIGPGPFTLEVKNEAAVEVTTKSPKKSQIICRAEPSPAAIIGHEFDYNNGDESIPVPPYTDTHPVLLQHVCKYW